MSAGRAGRSKRQQNEGVFDYRDRIEGAARTGRYIPPRAEGESIFDYQDRCK